MVGHVAVFIVETDKQQYGEAHGLRGVLRELRAAEILRRGLRLRDVQMGGKYSFQYVEDAVLEHCQLDTKDALWHAKHVKVVDSVIRGEYLAWYCENVTFENCTIIGTQPLCYCQGLKLINCKMVDCDLAFERSHVQASLTAPILSIKNPLTSSRITVPQVGEIIRDIPGADGEVLVENP